MKGIVFLLLVFLWAGCSQADVIPGDIIPKNKMETILWQLMQTDEFVNYTVVRDTTLSLDKQRIKLYNQVLMLNKVSREEFKKSYQFYMAHPAISKVMFDSLSVKGNRPYEQPKLLQQGGLK